jgi:hypothetical protein
MEFGIWVFFFLKICRENSNFIKNLRRVTSILREDLSAFKIISRLFLRIINVTDKSWGHAVAQLVDCATSRKVVGSIPDDFIGIFYWHNPSDRTMALGSTQSLTEISTGNISWGRGGGKGGRCVKLTTLPSSCVDCLEIWESRPPGTLRDCPGQ